MLCRLYVELLMRVMRLNQNSTKKELKDILVIILCEGLQYGMKIGSYHTMTHFLVCCLNSAVSLLFFKTYNIIICEIIIKHLLNPPQNFSFHSIMGLMMMILCYFLRQLSYAENLCFNHRQCLHV